MEISSTKPRQLSSRRLTSIDSEADRPVGVQRITVQRLFGQFDYDLKSETTDLSDLFILYGDNGSGKTTLLRLLFYILSLARAAGHRTAIQEIPFERFEVLLVDKTSIVLWRKNSIAGAYAITFSQVGMKPVTVPLVPLQTGKIASRRQRRKKLSPPSLKTSI